MLPERSKVLDEPALAADGWVEIEAPIAVTDVIARESNGVGWAGAWTSGKLTLIVSCAMLKGRPLLIVSASHKHGTKIRDTDRILALVREPHRDALESYAYAVRGPAQAKWLGFLAQRTVEA